MYRRHGKTVSGEPQRSTRHETPTVALWQSWSCLTRCPLLHRGSSLTSSSQAETCLATHRADRMPWMKAPFAARQLCRHGWNIQWHRTCQLLFGVCACACLLLCRFCSVLREVSGISAWAGSRPPQDMKAPCYMRGGVTLNEPPRPRSLTGLKATPGTLPNNNKRSTSLTTSTPEGSRHEEEKSIATCTMDRIYVVIKTSFAFACA